MQALWTRAVLALFCGSVLWGCGSSENNSGSGGSSGSGGASSGGTSSGGTSSGGTSSGGTSSGGTSGSSGSGGASSSTGGASTSGPPQSMMCDGTLCEGISLGIPGGPQTDACCPAEGDEPCGIETEFLEAYDINFERECQPLNSPGELSDECPESPPVMTSGLSFKGFPGCCLPSGLCGFMLDSVLNGLVTLNLGCIDARELPNPDFDDPLPCDPGAAGASGD